MTALAPEKPKARRAIPVHAEGHGAVLAVGTLVPPHLISGDELIHFAIKPSPWFVFLTSARWLAAAVCLCVLASSRWAPAGTQWYIWQLGVWIAVLRLGWAILDWASRLYVLTDRRVLRIRGVFSVELFDCNLARVQNTYLTLSPGERLTCTGTITFQTAGTGALASWQTVARPLDVHEKLREAVSRANHRGGNGC